MNIPQQSLKLKRVLGFTSCGRNSFVYQPNSSNLIYIAGCVIVIFDPRQNRQQHLYTDSKRAITTLAITDDGNYLAAASCGSQATICIWDLSNMLLVARLDESNVEVSCMCFSSNNKVLVSAGYRQSNSQVLNVWNWRQQSLVSSHKLATKVRSISFNWDSSYFVSVGDAHVKYWYLQYGNDEGQSVDDSAITISGSRSAVLGEQKANSFCGVKCGKGNMSEATFCITKSGLLCELNERRLLHKWVDLRTPSANSLAIGEDLIVVGCANGVVRCFNPTELRFLKNLPRPHSLGLDPVSPNRNTNISTQQQGASSVYPSVINVCLNEGQNTIACSHNDRSIYIWDLVGSNDEQIVKRYSALYHSSCIWGIDVYPNSPMASLLNHFLPVGSFITCSSDDTIRIWNPDMYSEQRTTHNQAANENCVTSNESLRIIFTDATCKYLCDLENSDQTKADENYDSNEGLRCLRISPDGRQLAVGSRSGAIRIFDFELDVEIKNIAAHDAEVLCLEYSDPNKFDGYCYLASSSRDKLIHIFDASDNYTFLQTIDDHLSSITALRFVNNRARDRRQLISCGADSRIIFRNGIKADGQLNFIPDQHVEGKNTFYDMEVDSESSCLITACQDRMIRLFNVAQVKYQSGFKGSLSNEGTIIKIALDPSCTFLATSSTDKSINIYDYQRGECIASISNGLSDLVTDMKFSPDGRHLIACSGDGCIFVWKSPPEIANAIGNNLGFGQLSLSSCSLGSINAQTTSSKKMEPVELNDQKEIAKKAAVARLKHLSGWAKQAGNSVEPGSPTNKKYSSSDTLYDDLTLMNKRYQVQNAQLNNSDDDRVRPSLRGNYSQAQISSAEETHPSPSQLSTRTDGDRTRQPKVMANAFKSRENLDQINLREKFVAQGLLVNDTKSAKSINNSSLSGQFNTKQSLDERGVEQQNYVNVDSSDGDEKPVLSGDRYQHYSNKSPNLINVRPITPPKPSLHRQQRRSSLSQSNQQLPDHPDYRESASKTVGRQRFNMYQAAMANNNRNASTMRPSKSECSLEMFGDEGKSGQLLSNNRKKIDLSRLHPSEVPLNQEFCLYLADELQALSKYAIKLYQRLLAGGDRYSSLTSLVASGIQNSRDILSNMTTLADDQGDQTEVNLTRQGEPYTSALSRRKANKQQSQPALSGLSQGRDSQDGPKLISAQTSGERTAKLKMDQVLEAYSDRLFKLVQERVVETNSNCGA